MYARYQEVDRVRTRNTYEMHNTALHYSGLSLRQTKYAFECKFY